MLYQIGTQFMQKVAPLILDLLVQTRHDDPRLVSVVAAFHLTAERLLRPWQLAGLRAIPARVVDCFACRERHQRLQAHVDTDMRSNGRIRPWGDRLFSHEADIPM